MNAIWHVIVFYFAWPYGNVWGNVLAIVPTGILGYIWSKRQILKIHKKMDKNHAEHMAHLRKIHKRLTDLE